MAKIQDIRKQTAGGASRRALSRIENIARHHSATNSGDYFAFWNSRWSKLGWKTGGYHEIILRDGTVQLCYDATVITNGIGGHNTGTYHICVVGNGSFTEAQETAFEERCKAAMDRFGLSVSKVLGHKEFSGTSTACPGIDMNIVRKRLSTGKVTVSAPKTEVKTEVVTKPSTSYDSVLGKGRNNRKSDIVSLQKDLIAKGFSLPKYGADGDFGTETEEAVKAFQRKVGITVDGLVGPVTLAKLNAYVPAKAKATYPLPNGVFRKGSKGESVKQIQRALKAANFDCGAVDGIYGSATEDAVRRFQSMYADLAGDGVYGPKTKNKLAEVLR